MRQKWRKNTERGKKDCLCLSLCVYISLLLCLSPSVCLSICVHIRIQLSLSACLFLSHCLLPSSSILRLFMCGIIRPHTSACHFFSLSPTFIHSPSICVSVIILSHTSSCHSHPLLSSSSLLRLSVCLYYPLTSVCQLLSLTLSFLHPFLVLPRPPPPPS